MRSTPAPALYYALFFLTGIATMLLSVLVPSLHLALSDEQIGRMVATQFVGQLLGALLVSRHTGRSLFLGLVLSTVGAAALGSGQSLSLLALFLYGLGLGITMTATNILAGTEATTELRASRMEMLNVFWPLGAACTPLVVRFGAGHALVHTYLFLALSFLLAIPILAVGRRNTATPALLEDSATQTASALHLFRLCMLCLLAVGIESALSNWVPTFATRLLHSEYMGGVASSVFWGGILVGRTTASFLLRRVRWSVFAIVSSLLAAASIVTIALAQSHWPLLAAAFCTAFCVGPVYPAVLARCVHLRRKNLAFFSAGIGSSALPWLVGLVSLQSRSLRWGMATPVVAALVLAAALKQESGAPV